MKHILANRIGRIEYLTGLILLYLILAGFLLLFTSFGNAALSAYLLFTLSSFPLSIRRLHDLDKSGWFVLVFFIPYVGFGWHIYLLFFHGTRGVNRFGPQPPSQCILWSAYRRERMMKHLGVVVIGILLTGVAWGQTQTFCTSDGVNMFCSTYGCPASAGNGESVRPLR
jgi:succinate dehydrogenase/fumarate reductase cytochrome b subunit